MDNGDVSDAIENNYEKTWEKRNQSNSTVNFDTKALLPTKCKERGVIRLTVEVPRPDGMSSCFHNWL